MVKFGAGPFLGQDYDFEIDESGDIRTNEFDRETADLEKDIAVRIGDYFESGVLGEPLQSGDIEDLRIDLGLLVNEDDRIEEILNIEIKEEISERGKITVDITADSGEGPFDLVIPIIL